MIIYSCLLLTDWTIAKFQMLMWRLCKISITLTLRQNFFLRKIWIVGIPKPTVLVNIFRVFMWPLSLINAGPQSIIHLQFFKMVSKKIRHYLLQARWKMYCLYHTMILQWHSIKIKISMRRLKLKWKDIVHLLKKRMMHCLLLFKTYLPLYWSH